MSISKPNRLRAPVQEEAERQKGLGIDFIDLNLGPARKRGPELMEWAVKIVQEVVDDVPLALDTSNIEAIEAGLAACKGKAMINSIMCRKERYEKMSPLCAKYNAYMIAILWGPQGMPGDEHERGELAVELIYAANEAGGSYDYLYGDERYPEGPSVSFFKMEAGPVK